MKRTLISLSLLFAGTFPIQVKAELDVEELFAMPIEELLQVNFRQSLKGALFIKKNALITQDTIVAEDIADFPDLNLAESIQRMPGVSITREGGEGRQISLRGVGPNFTRVQINGMETLAVSSSPMDSRNTLDYDRAFDFNVFASDLFSQIDINKSYSADQDEGGIGGMVVLHTPKPFAHRKPQLVLNVAAGDNSYTSDTSPRLSLLASNTWGDFGALASVVYSRRDTVEKGFNTIRWRAVAGGALSDDPGGNNRYNDAVITDPETVAVIESGDLWFSRSNRYSVWENTQERLGVNLAFQYRLPNQATLGLTFVHSKLQNDREEFHLGTGRSSSRWPGVLEDLEYRPAKDGETELIYAAYSNAELRSEHRVDEADTTYNQLVLDADWQLNEKLKVSGLLGWSRSEFEQPTLDKVFVISDPGTVTTDFRGDRFYGDIHYGIDTTDKSLWSTYDLYLFEKYVDDSFVNAKLDFDYALKKDASVTYGFNYRNYKNKLAQGEAFPDHIDPNSDSFTYVYSGSDDADWVVADINKAYVFYDVNTRVDVGGMNNSVEESTLGLYAQYNFLTELQGMPVTSSLGLRYVMTDVSLSNIVLDEEVDIDGNYQRWLPALNSTIELQEGVLGRFSISKNISRPYLAEQRVAVAIDTAAQTVQLNGNPDLLDPYESINVESSIEYYFDEIGYVALGVFWKDITGFTTMVTSDLPYGATGLPLSFLGVGQDANTPYTFTRLESTEDATIRGVELSLQRDFDFLPAPFNQMGVISNVTWAEGEATYRDVQGSGLNEKKSFPGLSEWSGNLTLYYETQNWGGRVLGAYRGEYISNVEPGLTDEDERGFHSTLYVDMKAYYKISDGLKVTLEGVNLTDEREEQYSDSNDRPYNINTSGTTVYLGLSLKL